MNIGEIAKQAGVSRSTVSYVLSGKRQIGDRTRARVMAIINEAGYVPSATARALAHGSTRTIALVVPPLHHRLNLEILSFVGAIAEVLAEHDFDTLLSPSGGDRPDAFPRLIRERRVDGVVLMETRIPDERVELLLAQDVPFVTVGRAGFDDRHDWVDTDYASLVRQAVEALHAAGHRHIALVNRPQSLLDEGYSLAVIADRTFSTTCAELGLTGTAVCCEEDDQDANLKVSEIVQTDPAVTGVVSVNDRALLGLVEALSARGLRVPDDVSVIAVAADRIAAHTSPPITAADVPAMPLSKAAVEMLLQRISSPGGQWVHELLCPPFTDRGSVRSVE